MKAKTNVNFFMCISILQAAGFPLALLKVPEISNSYCIRRERLTRTTISTCPIIMGDDATEF